MEFFADVIKIFITFINSIKVSLVDRLLKVSIYLMERLRVRLSSRAKSLMFLIIISRLLAYYYIAINYIIVNKRRTYTILVIINNI